MFLSGEDIYNNFQQAQGGEKLSNAAALVNDLSKLYDEQADEIKKLVGETEAVWKGDASGAAQRGLGPLAVEHALAAPALGSAQDLTNRQVGSFDDAKNKVIPVPPAPEKVDPLAAFMNPGAFVTYGEQLGTHKAAAQHNVDVMRGYENASVYNMSMPESYGQITADQSEIRVASPTPTGTDNGEDGGPDGPGSGPAKPPAVDGGGSQPDDGGGASPAGAVGSAGPGSSGGGGTGGGAVVVPPPQQGTTPGGYVPPPPVSVPGGGQGPGGGVPPGGQGSGYPGGGIGLVGVPDGGAGSGGPGAGGRGPGGAGAGGPGAGSPGVGGRPGVGPVGEPVAGQASGARGGGVAGRGGPGGMPLGAGAGKGQGGEDEEHERASFLQEPDPESVFGTNEITAPPVIGGQP